jgi:hypothetical protein
MPAHGKATGKKYDREQFKSPAAPKPMTTISDLGEPSLTALLNPRHAVGSGRPIPHLKQARRPAIDARKCDWWPWVHAEAFRELHHPLGVSGAVPGDMPGAATRGAD